MTTIQIAVRLPEDLVAQLDGLVPSAHASRSEALRRAVEVYLSMLANERDAAIYDRLPMTEDELALARDPKAWATAPSW